MKQGTASERDFGDRPSGFEVVLGINVISHSSAAEDNVTFPAVEDTAAHTENKSTTELVLMLW